MHRIERSEELDESMVKEVKLAGIVIAWSVCVLALVWLLAILLHAAEHYQNWKWILQ